MSARGSVAVDSATAPSVPPADAPALAALGDYAVGTTAGSVNLGPTLLLTPAAFAGGEPEMTERLLEVRIWYPARVGDGDAAIQYEGTVSIPGGKAIDFSMPGIAVEGAEPVQGEKFPLLVVTHGYGGWNTVMSNLTENIASKGYVVAAIDHADIPDDSTNPQLDFANVLINRSRDQRKVIEQLVAGVESGSASYASVTDASTIGLLGYSMGGFGALATAGAAYDLNGNAMNFLQLPQPVREAMSEPLPDNLKGRIKSLIVLAPWGAAPMFRSWTAESLQQLSLPVMVVDGDHDDVSDFENGVRWVYDNLGSQDRYLLVFQSARHNIANNPVHHYVQGLREQFVSLEYFSEPVWRTERINAINQHFVTAFLDTTLKGDTAKQAFLEVPTTASNDGDWPLAFGQTVGGAYAGDGQSAYWRGFQRRWALGLELHRATGEE